MGSTQDIVMAVPESQDRDERDNGWSLVGKKALVIGGTRGIGRAVVGDLLEHGASVIFCTGNEVEPNNCLRVWRDQGFTVEGLVCDVSLPEERRELIQQVASAFNDKLDILVINAGTNVRKPMVEFTDDDYNKIMNTNLGLPSHICQLSYRLLKASGNASIVFISSVAGLTHVGSGSFYEVSKAALNQLTKSLACEWAKDNIRSNCVATWPTKTSLGDPDRSRELLLQTPLQRSPKAKELSSLVTYLCLPVASFMTGAVIPVDGGLTL